MDFYAVDDEDKSLGIKADEEFDESCWIKANPLMDVNPHLMAAIRKEAVEAKQMPSKMAEFRIKRLNRPASTADGWVDLNKWQLCSGDQRGCCRNLRGIVSGQSAGGECL